MNAYRYVNWKQIEKISDGNQELISDLVNIFFQQIPVYSTQLDSLYAQHNYAALGKLAHKIKGSVSILGLYKLAIAMKELEELAAQGIESERYPEYIKMFKNTTALATPELNDILKRIKLERPC